MGQLLACGILVMIYNVAMCIYWPWRDDIVNCIDATVCVCISMFCFYSCATIEEFMSIDERRAMYGPYALGSFALAISCLAGMTLYAVRHYVVGVENDKRIAMEATRHMLLMFKAIWESNVLDDQKAWQEKHCDSISQHLTDGENIQFVNLVQTLLRETFLQHYGIKYADPKHFPSRLNLEATRMTEMTTQNLADSENQEPSTDVDIPSQPANSASGAVEFGRIRIAGTPVAAEGTQPSSVASVVLA